MNFFLDHDVPERVGDVLRQEGHVIVRLRDALPINTTDAVVLKYAGEHELILVTCNRDDFIPLARSRTHFGLIVLIRRRSRIVECANLLRLLNSAGESGLAGNINFA